MLTTVASKPCCPTVFIIASTVVFSGLYVIWIRFSVVSTSSFSTPGSPDRASSTRLGQSGHIRLSLWAISFTCSVSLPRAVLVSGVAELDWSAQPIGSSTSRHIRVAYHVGSEAACRLRHIHSPHRGKVAFMLVSDLSTGFELSEFQISDRNVAHNAEPDKAVPVLWHGPVTVG